MKSVDELLDSLRSHGTIDSSGEFTVSLKQARQKLTHYHSSDKARFLLPFVAAATAAGAREVTVTAQAGRFIVNMAQANLDETSLLKAFEQQSSKNRAASNLVFALQGALAAGATSAELEVHGGESESFFWTLTPEEEQRRPLKSAQPRAMEARLSFPAPWTEPLLKVFRRLGGYAGMPKAVRLVDQFCDRSLIPITVNGLRIDRPLVLNPALAYADVGALRAKIGPLSSFSVELSARPWKAALALTPGPVQIVVDGVSHCQLDTDSVSGTLYHDALKLDLSREKVVLEATYEQMVEQLEKVVVELYRELARRLDEVEPESVLSHLEKLVYLVLIDELDRANVQSWMESQTGKRLHLMQLYELMSPGPRACEEMLARVLAHCIQTLGGDQIAPRRAGRNLEAALMVYQTLHPEETLIPGYLLLGRGALFQLAGHKQQAEKEWFRALDVVWGGENQRAQELIYTHMGHSPRHMLEQTATALSMCLRDLAG